MPNSPPRPWPYRIGRLLQVLGLVIGLEAFLIFGFAPREGPMIYTALIAVAVFYSGFWLAQRYRPRETDSRK